VGSGPSWRSICWATRHWEPGKIGLVMTVAGVATVAARAPFGALIDWTR
jgi:hypothetical protein